MLALLLASVLLVLTGARCQSRGVNMRMVSPQHRVQGADRLAVAEPEKWRPYLIEWRGIEPNFRLDELTDALSIVLAEGRRGKGQVQGHRHEVVMLTIQEVVADSLSSLPVLGYCLLPPCDTTISEVCRRCSTIRSITEVYVDTGGGWCDGSSSSSTWAAATTPEKCVVDGRFDAAIMSAFVPRSQGQGQGQGQGKGKGKGKGKGQDQEEEEGVEGRGAVDNSWRVDFRRYGRAGRSGLSYSDKAALLHHFDPLFRRLHDHPDVDNFHACHTFLYLEDWSGFHKAFEAKKQMRGANIATSGSAHVPRRTFFGRVVATGRNYEDAFSVRKRPFIGTTTLDAISAQISANAARIVVPPVPQKTQYQPPILAPAPAPAPAPTPTPTPTQAHAPAKAPAKPFRVLDPFAGTCSLLLAAANLGAMVSGSDIDADGLGLSLGRGRVIGPEPTSEVDVHGSEGDGDGDCDCGGSGSGSGEKVRGQLGRHGLTSKRPKRSKNARFKRKREDGSSYVQDAGSILDNFAHYGLSDRLEKLECRNVGQWLRATRSGARGNGDDDDDDDDGGGGGGGDNDDDDLFDAIVTDPPFGRRECAHSPGGEEGDEDGDVDEDGEGDGDGGSNAIHAMLLAVAGQRLRPGGRLVFWLPTHADVTHETLLRDVLGPLERAAGMIDDGGGGGGGGGGGDGGGTAALAFVRARRQPLHSNLARWLCVYRRRRGPSQPSEPEVQVTVVRQ